MAAFGARRFLPRAETCVVDAYLTPVLRTYVERVAAAVNGAPLYFMTSGSGLVEASAFRGRDALTSGPAGGVVGVAMTAQAAGLDAVVVSGPWRVSAINRGDQP